RPLINKLGVNLGVDPLAHLGDATIAVTAALVLFVIPVSLRRREFVLDWRTAERMPWGILILFGGGLSLAAAISSTGLDKFIGQSMAGLAGVPPIVAVLIVTTTVVFLTELTSNTAIATAVLPVLAAAAPAMGVEPAHLLIPATIGASFAFMLPVATPPNAIVFGSGRVGIPDMAKAGFILNLIGIALAVLVAMTAGKFLIPAPTPPAPAALIAP
ncbi:MAG: SLC13 family permease, partial [Phycisphaerales bacterium]